MILSKNKRGQTWVIHLAFALILVCGVFPFINWVRG